MGLFLLRNWKILALVGMAVAAMFWAYHLGAHSRQAEIEQLKTAHMVAVANAERQAREDSERRQKVVDQQAVALDEAYRANAEQALALNRFRTTADAARADAGRVRDSLATTRLAGQAGVDAAAACNARAGAYEALLARSDELLRVGRDLAIRLAEAHDDRAAEVTALLKAWPQ